MRKKLSRLLQTVFDRLPKKQAVLLANSIYSDRRFALDDDGDWLCIQPTCTIASPTVYRQRLESIRAQTQEYFLPYYTPQPSDLVVDLGAGIGEETISLADRVRHIVAIEAHPVTFRCLRKTVNLSALNNVEIIHCAISNESGTVTISDDEDHVSNSIAKGSGIEVPAQTLSVLCESKGIRSIDFLKANIEGAERLLLAGADGIEIRNVAIACHDFIADETGDESFRTKAFVCDWLETRGFEVRIQRSVKPWISDTIYARNKNLA